MSYSTCRRIPIFVALTLGFLTLTTACAENDPRLPVSNGWNAADDANIPEIPEDISTDDWQRLQGPVTGRPQIYTGDTSASFVDAFNTNVRISDDFLLFAADTLKPSQHFGPQDQLPGTDYVAVDIDTGDHQSWLALNHYMEDNSPGPVNWLATADDRTFAAVGDQVAVRRDDGTFTTSRQFPDATLTLAGSSDRTLFVIASRPRSDQSTLWRWTGQGGWSTVFDGARNARLLRGGPHDTPDANSPFILTRDENGGVHWSDDLGDTWSPLTIDTGSGDSIHSVSATGFTMFHSTETSLQYIKPYGDHSGIWRTNDMQEWSRVPLDIKPPVPSDPTADGPRGALYVDHRTFDTGVFVTDTGPRQVSLPTDNAKVVEVARAGGRWLLITAGPVWTASSPDGDWRQIDLRLPSPPQIGTATDILYFHQEPRAHAYNYREDQWVSADYIESRDRGITSSEPLAGSPFIGGANRLFLLTSQFENDVQSSTFFHRRLHPDTGFDDPRPFDFQNLPGDSRFLVLNDTVVWNDQITTYIDGEGLYALRNDRMSWAQVGDKITSDAQGIELDDDADDVNVSDLTTFNGNLYGLASGAGSQNAIVRWNQSGSASVSLHETPRYIKNDGEYGRSSVVYPDSLHATSDVLIAHTTDLPRSDPDDVSQPLPAAAFVARDASTSWQWIKWPHQTDSGSDSSAGPPDPGQRVDPDVTTNVMTARHSLFVITSDPTIYRYNPAEHAWNQLPLPPKIQSMPPDNFHVTPDGDSLFFQGRRAGLYELSLTSPNSPN